MLLYIKGDSSQNRFFIGDRLLVSGKPRSIKPPKNPHQFNYKNYLSNKKIYHQLFTEVDKVRFVSSSKNIFRTMEDIRNSIEMHLERYNFSQDQISMIKAILLGQKKDLSKDIMSNYSDAGVIHILAISGLHVGIVFWILSFLLSPLSMAKNGELLIFVFTFFFLFSFAFISGLSSSVLRAVIMCLFVSLGKIVNRSVNIYNSLAISALSLLICDPYQLFSVGFQLSYTAVFFIVWIQPTLSRLFKPRNKILKYLWTLSSVSIAAQLGVLPFSIYYFHKIPLLFLISNVVLIPFIWIIIFSGIAVTILSFFYLPDFLVQGYGWIISAMNYFVKWVASFEYSVWDNVKIDEFGLVLLYMLIVFLVFFLKYRRVKYIYIALGSVLVLQIREIFNSRFDNNLLEWMIFSVRDASIMGIKDGRKLLLISDSISSEIYKHTIDPYVLGLGLRHTEVRSLQSVFSTKAIKKTKYFISVNSEIILSIGLDFPKKIKELTQVDYLWLRAKPNINFDILLEKTKPKLVFFDGGYYKNQFKKQCDDLNIVYRDIDSEGFFSTGQK
ncbi:competence protein [Ichthyobacterium seriolicida]|uniref:Competence protein n=2 Tax=Ichthyobacterium seriolicida TaxID=242600 RepID=A0A1J1E0J2_9FLAO|nr:competence protein [Ichthyobacterium seriolicida]